VCRIVRAVAGGGDNAYEWQLSLGLQECFGVEGQFEHWSGYALLLPMEKREAHA